MDKMTKVYRRDNLTINAETIKKGKKTLWDGDFIAYYPDGQRAMTGSYLYGKPHGTWWRWYENGRLASVHNYVLGTLNGRYIQFYDNGDKAREGTYVGGTPEGDHRVYLKGGKPRKTISYKAGKLLRVERLIGGRWTIADLQNMVWQIGGNDLHFDKVCQLYDNGELICKTPAQIVEDLSSVVDPETVAEVLEHLNDLYEEYGLNTARETLVGCADTVFAMEKDASGAPTVALTENPNLNRAPMTQREIDTIFSACREASLGQMGLNQRLPGFNQQRDDFVRDTVGAIDESVMNCRETGNSLIAIWTIVIAGGRLLGKEAVKWCIGNPFKCGVVGNWTASAGESLLPSWDNDGFGDPIDPNADPQVSYHKDNPNVSKAVWRSGKQVIERPTVEGEPGVKVTVETGDGFTTTRYYDEDGRLIKAVIEDEDGNVSEFTPPPPPAPPPPPPPPEQSEPNPPPPPPPNEEEDDEEMPDGDNDIMPDGDADLPHDGAAPSTGQPDPDNPMGRCEQLRMGWAQLKANCEQSNWQTYECEQVLRTFHGCVDLAEIYPTPDGGVACAQPSGWTPGQAREEACRRRGMISIPDSDGFGHDGCQPPENLGTLEQDICLDPAAMCRPDAMLTAELRRDSRAGLERRDFRGLSASLSDKGVAATYAVAPREDLKILDDDTFFEAIGAAETPQVVVFGAKTCQPCERVKRNLSGIEFELGRKVEVCYVEVPQNPDLATEFDIRFTPTMMVFQGGRVLGQRRVGAATREMLARYIDRSLKVGSVDKDTSMAA